MTAEFFTTSSLKQGTIPTFSSLALGIQKVNRRVNTHKTASSANTFQRGKLIYWLPGRRHQLTAGAAEGTGPNVTLKNWAASKACRRPAPQTFVLTHALSLPSWDAWGTVGTEGPSPPPPRCLSMGKGSLGFRSPAELTQTLS